MADPLACLRASAIVIGIWNIIYACIQIGVFGWQVQVVKNLMAYWENREIPDSGLIYSDFKARFPGLYQIYTETPERRRISAMYPIVLITHIVAFVHVPASCLLLWAAIKRRKNLIWPYFFTGAVIVVLSTAYAVLWWSGDVFTEQLVMSVAEFVMSIAITGPSWFVVLFFYIRLNGQLQSGKPTRGTGSSRGGGRRPYDDVPTWRTEWPDRPPRELELKLRRESRQRREKELRRLEKEQERIQKDRRRVERERRAEEAERQRRYRPFNADGTMLGDIRSGNVDYYVPRPQEQSFPWNSPIPRQQPEQPVGRPRKKSAAEVIENLYYEHYPEDMPKQVGALRREQH